MLKMWIFSVFTFIAYIMSYVYCSPYTRLEERVHLVERKQFYDSVAFREDIKSLSDIVKAISNDTKDDYHLDCREQELTKVHVKKLDDTVKAVRRSISEEKHHFRNMFDDIKTKLWNKEEHLNTHLISIKKDIEEGFNRITTNDIQVKSRVDYTVSVLEKLSKQLEQTHVVNEKILEQMRTFSVIFDGVVKSLSLTNEQSGIAKQNTSCGKWKTYKNACYFVGNNGLSFDEASDRCEALDGHLAKIESEDENKFLSEMAEEESAGVANSGAWVGGTDRDNDGVWVWYKSKTPFTFTAWKSNEPNGGTSENCVHLYRSYQWLWNDSRCVTKMSYICERKLSTT